MWMNWVGVEGWWSRTILEVVAVHDEALQDATLGCQPRQHHQQLDSLVVLPKESVRHELTKQAEDVSMEENEKRRQKKAKRRGQT